jgi:hypothetical protein
MVFNEQVLFILHVRVADISSFIDVQRNKLVCRAARAK